MVEGFVNGIGIPNESGMNVIPDNSSAKNQHI